MKQNGSRYSSASSGSDNEVSDQDNKREKSYQIVNEQIEDDIQTHDFTRPHCSRQDIEKLVGFRVKNIQFYLKALTHKSIKKAVVRLKNRVPSNTLQPYLDGHNERLEFLGDSILGSVVADHLYKKFPDKDEGFLTKLKIKIVNGEQLAEFANDLEMDRYILTSNHIKNIQGKQATAMLENAFEAVIGAIQLDLGWEFSQNFITNAIERSCNWRNLMEENNYKDVLLKWSHREKKTTDFQVESISGPAHNRKFKINVLIDGVCYGTYEAPSKKKAQQECARQALVKLKVKFKWVSQGP